MGSAFDPMPTEQKQTFRETYLAYLRARDGVPDVAKRAFDVREGLFAALDAARSPWVGPPPVDQAVFDRNHARRRPEPGLDEVTLWALATARTNRAERYGVELSLNQGAPASHLLDDPHTYIEIEEIYHTRILRDALGTLGLSMEIAVPTPRTRLLVHAMVYLPERLSNIAVLAGEIVGVTIFTLLLERARALFAHQPAALARIEQLFAQILVDEVGHVTWLRSQVSDAGLAWAKRLIPLTVATVLDDIPELALLFGRDAVLRHALAADVDGAAAPYPDRLVIAAA